MNPVHQGFRSLLLASSKETEEIIEVVGPLIKVQKTIFLWLLIWWRRYYICLEVILESHNNKNFVGSVIHPAGNIAEALLKEGMAKCVDLSITKVTGGHEKYRAAEKSAKERKSRIWKDKKNIPSRRHMVSDISGNVIKCKQFLPVLVRGGRMPGLVEFVASSFRFRVFIPKEACIVSFLLSGVSCPTSGHTLPSGKVMLADPYADLTSSCLKLSISCRSTDIGQF
jgi:hypothetical protein